MTNEQKRALVIQLLYEISDDEHGPGFKKEAKFFSEVIDQCSEYLDSLKNLIREDDET